MIILVAKHNAIQIIDRLNQTPNTCLDCDYLIKKYYDNANSENCLMFCGVLEVLNKYSEHNDIISNDNIEDLMVMCKEHDKASIEKAIFTVSNILDNIQSLSPIPTDYTFNIMEKILEGFLD